MNNALLELKAVKQKLLKVTKERDYYKSFSENVPGDDSAVLASKLKTLVDFSDELVNAGNVVDFNDTKQNLREILSEIDSDKLENTVKILEDENKALEARLEEE
jgi:hypothetical protein